MAVVEKPLLARCRAATKNANAAALLYRIAYWMPKATVTHGGKKLIANSAEQWCYQTGLSYDEYRRAKRRLKDLGLIEIEQHLFGSKNVTHIRITDAGNLALEEHTSDSTNAACPEE